MTISPVKVRRLALLGAVVAVIGLGASPALAAKGKGGGGAGTQSFKGR